VIVGAVFLYVFLTAKGRRARILLGKAKIALKRSRFAEAEGLLRGAAEIRAGDGGIRFHLGRALEAQGKMKEAREEYGKALALAPDLFEATIRFASVCMALKDFDAAEKALNAAEERGKKRKAFPHDAQIRFLRGQVLLAQRHGDKAEGEFREAIALNRRLLPPRFALVRCLIARRDIKEAEKQLKAIIEVSPENEEARIYLATLYEFQGKPDVARWVLEEIVKRSPGHEIANLMLGDMLIKAGDFDSALRLAERVQEKNAFLGHLIKGQLFVRRRDFVRAEEAYREVVARRPGWPKGHYLLAAAAAMRKEDMDLVIRESKAAIEADSRFLPARFLLLDALMAKGELDGAIREAKAILARSPKNGRAMRILFIAAARQKKLKEAEAAFQELLAKDAENESARFFLGLTKLYGLEVDDAMALGRELLEKMPRADPAYDLLAAAHHAKKDLLEAIDQLRALAEEDPKFAYAHINLAKIYVSLGRRDLAEAEFRTALAKNPGLMEAEYGLALLLAGEKRYPEAMKLLRRLSEKRPKNVAILQALARVLQLDGKYGEAIAAAKRILDLVKDQRGALSITALAYIADGRYGEAEPYLERLLLLDRRVALGYRLGLILALRGEYERALGICEAALKELKDTRYHLILSQIHAMKGDMAQAIASCWKAKDPAPRGALAQIMLFGLFVAVGDQKGAEGEIATIRGLADEIRPSLKSLVDLARKDRTKGEGVGRLLGRSIAFRTGGLEREALAAEKELLDLLPENLFVLLHLAAMRRSTGRHDEALALYRRAIKAHPRCVAPRLGLSQLFRVTGKYDEARETMREALALKKGIPGIHLTLGLVCERLGRDKEAAEEYALHLKEQPDSAVAANNLAWLYAKKEKDLKKAITLAEKAIKRWPRNPHIADTLGWLYYLSGKKKEAIELLRRASRGLPRNPAVRYHYGRALLDAKETRRGLGEIKTALLISADFPGAKEARTLLEKEKK
jgi:tetratricopeptide (TPR) repeat protein